MKKPTKKEDIEAMEKMIETCKIHGASMDKTIGLILPLIKIDLPSTLQDVAINAIETSYDTSLINVKRILQLPIPTQYVAHSNFLFGRNFGKTELLLQILKGKTPSDVLL